MFLMPVSLNHYQNGALQGLVLRFARGDVQLLKGRQSFEIVRKTVVGPAFGR